MLGADRALAEDRALSRARQRAGDAVAGVADRERRRQ
jgi:hypothetical protein